jgi:hypothetical protein
LAVLTDCQIVKEREGVLRKTYQTHPDHLQKGVAKPIPLPEKASGSTKRPQKARRFYIDFLMEGSHSACHIPKVDCITDYVLRRELWKLGC